MLILSKKLFDLPVYTKGGQLLGEVDDIEIETDGQLVVNYQVGSKSMLKNLLGNKLIINREQIVSISEEKIVVDDNLAEQKTMLSRVEKKGEPEMSEGIVVSVRKN